MKRARTGRLMDVAFWVSTLLLMGSGLLLLIEFHAGSGARATEFAGLSKAWWRNLHRAGLLFMLPGLATHLWRYRACVKSVFNRCRRALIQPRPALDTQFFLLLAFTIVASTGFAAWAALPHHVETWREARHTCIDVHNVAGVVLVVALACHVIRHHVRRGRKKRIPIPSASGQ